MTRFMYIIGIICLLAILMLVACDSQPAVSETLPIALESQTQPETIVSQPKKKNVVPTALRRLKWSDYSLSLMEQWVDTDTFISAEMLQTRFGNFEEFLFDANVVRNDPAVTGYTIKEIHKDFYTYSFSKDNGGKYDLDVKVEKLPSDGEARYLQETMQTLSKDKINPYDLRTADRAGTYRVGKIEYIYEFSQAYDSHRRALTGIQWKGNGYVFSIIFNKSAIDYALDDGGFIAQLLREETAEDAIEQFNKDISLAR